MLRVPWFLLSCGDPRGSLGLCRGSQQVPGEFCLLLFPLLLIKTFPLTLSFWPFQTTDLRLKEALQKPEGDPEAKHTTCCLISPLCLSSGREDTPKAQIRSHHSVPQILLRHPPPSQLTQILDIEDVLLHLNMKDRKASRDFKLMHYQNYQHSRASQICSHRPPSPPSKSWPVWNFN